MFTSFNENFVDNPPLPRPPPSPWLSLFHHLSAWHTRIKLRIWYSYAVETCLTDTMLLHPPLYYSHFILAQRKALSFSYLFLWPTDDQINRVPVYMLQNVLTNTQNLALFPTLRSLFFCVSPSRAGKSISVSCPKWTVMTTWTQSITILITSWTIVPR